MPLVRRLLSHQNMPPPHCSLRILTGHLTGVPDMLRIIF
jgi:hypothetical protein